jgi:hypothetical protein
MPGRKDVERFGAKRQEAGPSGVERSDKKDDNLLELAAILFVSDIKKLVHSVQVKRWLVGGCKTAIGSLVEWRHGFICVRGSGCP